VALVTDTPGVTRPHGGSVLKHLEPQNAIESLAIRFENLPIGGVSLRLKYWRRKWLWKISIGGSLALKRAVEFLIAAIALVALSPLFALVGLLIKVCDRGPILFWQTRVGHHGKLFPFPKFRSMVVGAESLKSALAKRNDHADGITFKMKRDPRVTWIGRLIRKSSIDELPQLWCVLKGELALVGPRPAVPGEVARYSLADRRRLDVKPGLTCIWQVSGRGTLPFDRQVALDIEYINSQSFALDLLIVLRTIPAVLTGRGAY
jgi:lipopolysaccharide/colanic/teichoic acid biosynthesis glycosyltransferase